MHALQPPQLVVVIDTEEEFDWSQPPGRKGAGVTAMREIGRAQEIFDRFGIVPAYVVDFPVATQPEEAPDLLSALEDGRAQIGAHLNSWTTPPLEHETSPRFSFQGNLPKELERAKLVSLKHSIEENFGITPLMHKAGRYGVGPHTAGLLSELGFLVDLSWSPGFDASAEGGPDFRRASNAPQWLGPDQTVLELPTTGGFTGVFAGLGPVLYPMVDTPVSDLLRIKAVLSRLGLLERLRLSPEGYTLAELKRLARALVGKGVPALTFSFHSPSLAPGFTPYVRTPGERDAFLGKFGDFFTFFRDELGGRFTTPLAIRESMLEASL